jgi:hypothetical protein
MAAGLHTIVQASVMIIAAGRAVTNPNPLFGSF